MNKKDPKEPKEQVEDKDLVWKEKDEEEETDQGEVAEGEPRQGRGESVKGEAGDEEPEEEAVDNDKTSDSVRMEESAEEKAELAEEEERGGEGEGEEQKEEEGEQAEEVEEQEEEKEEEEGRPAHEDIKRSDILRRDLNQFVRDNQPGYSLNPQNRGSSKKLVTLILFILAIVVIGGGIYFIAGLGGSKIQQSPTPTPSATPMPTPTPKPLNRSEWSFEVLNGSGVTGAAKKLADQLKALGYPVVKSGNADRDDYTSNQFFVKKELEEDVELVILDIRDIIKIASISGELKDSTASARIIIGK